VIKLKLIDNKFINPTTLLRLINSTNLKTVLSRTDYNKQRDHAGFRIGNGRQIDIWKYAAWLSSFLLEDHEHENQDEDDIDSKKTENFRIDDLYVLLYESGNMSLSKDKFYEYINNDELNKNDDGTINLIQLIIHLVGKTRLFRGERLLDWSKIETK